MHNTPKIYVLILKPIFKWFEISSITKITIFISSLKRGAKQNNDENQYSTNLN